MGVIVKVQARGARNVVDERLRVLRARLDGGRGVVAVWMPATWQPNGPDQEAFNDTVEIELQDVEKRVSALQRVRDALAQVDPSGEVLGHGDLDLEPLPL